eukprot:jgi/Mesvir1/12915/Mv05934-RA.1
MESPWTQIGENSSAVAPLVSDLVRKRCERETAYTVRTCLRQMTSEFSHIRLRGLHDLLLTIQHGATYSPSVSISNYEGDVKIIPVLLSMSLATPSSDAETATPRPVQSEVPPKAVSPVTEEEALAALSLLQGCCLLDPKMKATSHASKAVKALVENLPLYRPAVQRTCLDTLLSLLVDNEENQREFGVNDGIAPIAHLLSSKFEEQTTRWKCVEFLHLLLVHILRTTMGAPSAGKRVGAATRTPGSESLDANSIPRYTAEHAQRSLRAELGDRIAGMILEESCDVAAFGGDGKRGQSLARLDAQIKQVVRAMS